jgi:uncharacterized protein (TIGR01777 family)
MNVTVTGASGLIGRRLVRDLLAGGHAVRVLSRRAAANPPAGVRAFAWDGLKSLPPAQSVADADAVVHLAGEPVAQRWTAEARNRIHDSRIVGTRHLVAALSALPRKPEVLVSASAIGYYGDRGDEVLDESSAPGSGFLADVCRDWEAEAGRAAELGIRVVTIRIGIVLAPDGGALARMLPAFRAFAGGRIGSGRQWMSWIHIDDLAGLFTHVTKSPLHGAVNGTAPHPVTNIEFTRTLAGVLGRPALLSVPGFALKAALGDMAGVLLGGQRVLPRAALAGAFKFAHPELPRALESLLHR